MPTIAQLRALKHMRTLKQTREGHNGADACEPEQGGLIMPTAGKWKSATQ